MEPSAIHYEDLQESTANPEVIVNQIADNLEFGTVYSYRHAGSDGLTWAYWGGRWGGIEIADDTLTLTNAEVNYISVERATGVIGVEAGTDAVDWFDTDSFARVYAVTVAGNVVTDVEDHRAGPFGIHGQPSASATPTAGRHMIFVSAAAMRPRVSNGCAALATIEATSDRPNITGLNFDASSAEFAQFHIEMPKSWNAGTATFEPVWRHGATATNFGVCWKLQAVAVSDDDTIDAAFGTAQSSVDTGGTTNDKYVGPESSAITIAGTPAKQDGVFFQVSRDPADGGDTLAVDATLLGLRLYITTDADTDA